MWWLDEFLLFNCYDDLIAKHLKSCLMDVLPKEGERGSMSRSVVAARTLCTGSVCTAQAKTLERELSNACNLLQDISEGKGPAPQSAATFGFFALQFLKRCEIFAFCQRLIGLRRAGGNSEKCGAVWPGSSEKML